MTNKIICGNCNTENDASLRVCVQCDADLNPQKICLNCETKNNPDAKFCSECGQSLDQRANARSKPVNKTKHRKNIPPQKTANRPLIIAALAIAVFLIYLFMQDNQQSSDNQGSQAPVQPAEQKSADPGLEAKVANIAGKFICSCGNCGEEPLESCTCQTAVNERNYIRTALQAGFDSEHIIQSVNQQYGWLKPQFKEKYGEGKQAFKQKESTLPTLITPDKAKLASLADRLQIISKFHCPCGQCEFDELKDCECNHPRGAEEVKTFIDTKINEGKYSVNQITELVEQQYGNRIR